MKKAAKSGAAVALIMGEDEVQSGQVQVKSMRGQYETKTIAVHAVSDAVRILI
jgi:histidyl-tRNA synthetase